MLTYAVLYPLLAGLTVGALLASPSSSSPLPVVVWHGLGDSATSEGMVAFAKELAQRKPGLFVHNIYVDEDQQADQRAGFFGNVDDQLERVCEQLKEIPELAAAPAIDAIGFSQGGQFLRGYLERCNAPPIRNLITFGSQHLGIEDLPLCKDTDYLCKAARAASRWGVWTNYAQSNLVQAQYYRDPTRYETYLGASGFLADINNERIFSLESPLPFNATYATNVRSLNRLVLFKFSKDVTVVPKSSSWFGASDPDRPGKTLPMRTQPIYLHESDPLGLRGLDDEGRIVFAVCEGEHMQLSEDCWGPAVDKWLGGREWDDGREEDKVWRFPTSNGEDSMGFVVQGSP